jgi:cobalamin transport system substrate-binding protein
VALGGCSESKVSGQTGGGGFPVKVAAANGEVTIPHRPSRIVSLSATGTEDLYAVGAGGQVVAVDSYSAYPPQAPRTQLSGFKPNVEAIAGYRPDLVVVAEDTDHIAAQLGKLHIPVLVERPAPSLSSAYEEIAHLGQATGHADGAKPVIENMKGQVAAIVRSVPPPRKPLSVYHELEQTYYSATSQTFIGQMYTMLGLTNIADKARRSGEYPQLSAEYIIASNPDLIVLADTVCCAQSARTVAARPGWKNITAVKRGDIFGVDDSIASEWGPRMVLFLKKVASELRIVEGRSR